MLEDVNESLAQRGADNPHRPPFEALDAIENSLQLVLRNRESRSDGGVSYAAPLVQIPVHLVMLPELLGIQTVPPNNASMVERGAENKARPLPSEQRPRSSRS